MDWAKKIEELSKHTANEPEGNGWFTADEFRAKGKIGYSRSYALLKQARLMGKAEVHKGSSYSEELKQLVPCVWYRFISPK